MKIMNVKITFIEPVLGTSPANEDIYRDFIGSNAPDAPTLEEEVAALGADAVAEKGMTIFPKLEDGTPFLYDYQVKGFFKDACSMLTLTPPNEWVSVEDAVPDPGERVLATDGIFVGEAYRSSANSWFRHTGFPWRDGVTGRTVRFWTPMPAPPDRRPPEGEEDNND